MSMQGRVIEGYVTSCGKTVIEYSYHWRGVRYEASQDISDLRRYQPELHDFSGPATVKFLGARPSNSIVIAEKWSGIPRYVRQGSVLQWLVEVVRGTERATPSETVLVLKRVGPYSSLRTFRRASLYAHTGAGDLRLRRCKSVR